jgi:tetratricopeptide (TPR) repeat protein
VRLLARLAGALRDEPSLEQRSSLGRRAVEIARRIGDPDTLGYALASLFTATWGPDIEEVRAIVEEVTRLAEETGEAERALDACWLRRIFFLSLGDVTQVEQAAEEHRMLAEALKQPSQQWYDAVMRSTWALYLGAFPEAEKLANDALRLGRRAQSWDAVFSYRMALFFLRREQDRLAEVEELTRRAVDEYTGYRSFPCLLALLEWELGRPEDARHAFEELAIDDFVAFPRDSEWLFCLCVLSEVAGHLRDRERASTLYRLLAPYSAMNALAAGEVAIGSVARYVGILACAASLWEEAGRHFEDALVFNERMGAKPWLAHTQEDYARMLLARAGPGDRGRAAELLSQAHATYRELGMKCDAAEASAVPQETGTDAPSPQR